MSEEYSSDSGEREDTDFQQAPNELSHIKKVIGVVSGKGGVGKTLVTSLLAVSMQRSGYKTAVMDADITGPSVPGVFGINTKAEPSGDAILPVKSSTGISIMSINLLLENETDPVVWRGPIIAGTVRQFWTDVIWGDIDFMFVDLPPGTGDVPLTVFQSLPLDGIVIVTSPQQLVSMIVGKAVKMARMMDIPILGIIENMSYAVCPDCGREISIFGKSRIEETAAQFGIEAADRLPADPVISELCDSGSIESVSSQLLDGITEVLRSLA